MLHSLFPHTLSLRHKWLKSYIRTFALKWNGKYIVFMKDNYKSQQCFSATFGKLSNFVNKQSGAHCLKIHIKCLIQCKKQFRDSSHKSHNAPVPYPTTHHFVAESAHMCTFLFQNSALRDTALVHYGILTHITSHNFQLYQIIIS